MKKKIELPIKAFINRTRERSRLKQLLTEQHEGIRVLLIKGNVGVGKTRLIKEVLDEIKQREVIWGDCSYLADYVAYYPIRELIKAQIEKQGKNILKHLKPIYRTAIRKLVPEAAGEFTEEDRGLDIMIDKFKFYEGVKELIGRGKQAKIIVVDNLQWIDQGSAHIIRYLIRTLKSEPITFVFIFRTDEETEVLNNLITSIRDTVEITEISLNIFAKPEVKEIIASLLGEEPQDELVEYIVHWSGGNPFYIEEVISGLIIDENLIIKEDRWRFIEPEKGIVPKSITEIAVAKYLSLKKEAQNVLEVASVIGWFDIAIIHEITGYPPGEIIGLIEEISNIGLVRYSDDRIEFSDEISRNAIYEKAASRRDIAELHTRIGDRIKERSKDKERRFVDILAFHYYRARNQDKGVRFCIQAGDNAAANYASHTAVKYYMWAVELLKGSVKKNKQELRDSLLKKIEELKRKSDSF
ncbi:MAG TPA: hypothetical protein ENI34_00435 [candidate division WOR-3 bacterium]|uniref:Orc1-like AAA ATPase domain-containing protein n=1 Tax=candidate division WOR-3 bacterium TaxID=2052148 RepID=A0A9C9JZA4_UNCW3|nr:hypothetical protein [candidate division WOR-3 bacterium]